MREIKFRFYSTENHNMVSDVCGIYHGGKKGDRLFFMPDDEVMVNIDHPDLVVEQFTGLKDKNGKEIYKGDILQDEEGIGSMVWLDSRGGWAVSTKINGYFYPHSWGEYKLKNTAVIGNIHENPELLERGKCN